MQQDGAGGASPIRRISSGLALLDETDRDIVTIVGDLFQALHRALLDWLPPPPETLGLPSAASQPVSLGLALTQALDQAATDFTVLVIDDFHLVDDSPAVVEFFDSFIESLPPQLHVILLSRRIPPLKIASLAARQEIAGMSEEHLRFTAAEVQALLQKRNNLTLPANDAETLVSHTEGWITGILLSSQLIWRGLLSNVGMGREQYGMVYDYLAEEVLEQQPQDLRLFLMEAAVLPEMDPASCDAIWAQRQRQDAGPGGGAAPVSHRGRRAAALVPLPPPVPRIPQRAVAPAQPAAAAGLAAPRGGVVFAVRAARSGLQPVCGGGR
jgi:LuxR family maltose regulon positive regulatory protein